MRKFIALTALFVVAALEPANAQDLEVSITTPVDGAKVPYNPTAEGTVSDDNAEVWVIVHPTAVDRSWVQPKPKISRGGWIGPVYFGQRKREHVGQEFEVMAVANPFKPLREGMVLFGWPDAEAQSRIKRVERY